MTEHLADIPKPPACFVEVADAILAARAARAPLPARIVGP